MTKKITKRKQVEDHLITTGSITSLEAINLFWATRLSGIIFNLKQDGWQFVTDKVKHDTGSYYAKYILISAPTAR